jgi:Xaa-Pro dipeptidase
MAEGNIDVLVLTDPDSVYYLSGYWGYLGMEFGRPTFIVVPASGPCVLVTPAMEAEMAHAMTWIEDIREWTDGTGDEWRGHLRDLVPSRAQLRLAVERYKLPPVIGEFLHSEWPQASFENASPIIDAMRMVKAPDEIATMRQAGQVAIAMADGAAGAICEGAPEYEVALAVIAAGTRKAAEFLSGDEVDRLFSPTIYNLQILQSGKDLAMVHRRSTVRRLQTGDPVYLCFCGIANYKQFKLGFDREFFVRSVTDEQARLYEVALQAQAAALSAIRPGVLAEEAHAAAEEVYRQAGFGIAYRTGRGIGLSFLEQPELKRGDLTPLRAGMTLAVDGGVTVPGEFGARVGDSIVVTETGFEYLTPYPKQLRVLSA